jgi:hypothetical protein
MNVSEEVVTMRYAFTHTALSATPSIFKRPDILCIAKTFDVVAFDVVAVGLDLSVYVAFAMKHLKVVCTAGWRYVASVCYRPKNS